MRAVLILLNLLVLSVPAYGQLWSSVLDTNRAIDWSIAGAAITNRTVQCGATITPYAGAATTINNALAACPSGQYVQLAAGTFTINSGAICMKSNVTLRGMGADQTKIVSTSSGTCTASYGASIVFSGTPLYPPSPPHTAAWTGGYSKGSISIALSNTTGLQVGTIVMLDQDDDPNTPVPNDIWVCKNAGACSTDGAIAFMRTNRNQVEAAKVIGISGNTVTIERGLHMPNWRSARNPGAYWSSGLPIREAGLENLTLDTGNSNEQHGIVTENAYSTWITGVRLIDGNPGNPKRCLLCSFAASVKNTTRNNYMYGSRGAVAAAGTYGYELRGASLNLHENNIWEDNTVPFVQGQASIGNVYGYNYTFSNWYVAGSGTWPSGCGVAINCNWMQASARYHAIANNYTLFESTEGNGFTADALRGASVFGTSFRSFWSGWDPQGGANTSAGKTQQTVAVNIYAYNRYFNFIGNVLGEPGKHTNYQCSNTTTTDNCPGYLSTVFVMGFSGNGSSNGIPNDSRVRETIYRWGNYDIVTGAARWSASEVPTSDAFYPQSVPSSQALPTSFYLSSKPWWYRETAWPSIGPDVSGTMGPGNKVNKIPAHLCYESMSDDPAYGTQIVRIFNANTCYGPPTGSSDITPPATPLNLTIS